MDAARLKRARRRMRAFWIGGAVIGALVFLCLAALIMAVIGVEKTSYLAALVFAALVLAGGTYAIILFVALAVHIAKRAWNRQPIMDREAL